LLFSVEELTLQPLGALVLCQSTPDPFPDHILLIRGNWTGLVWFC